MMAQKGVKRQEALVLTVEEAAALLGISRVSAYQAARAGEIPTIRIGRLLRVPKLALELKLQGAARESA